MRKAVLSILHEIHIGIVRMKLLARSNYWWPKIDAQVEEFVNSWETCAVYQKINSVINHTEWPQTKLNWERLHTDFFQKFNIYFLIIIDSYSR